MELIPRPDLEAASFDIKLFGGCALEAQRADTVALQLEGLGNSLTESSIGHLAIIVEEIHWIAAFLRELADYSQIHQDRIPIVLNHLNVVLPCISRTLRDIQGYIENKSMTKRNRWRTMYHEMKEEADGIELAQRFSIYKYFLTSLRDVLIRFVYRTYFSSTASLTDKGYQITSVRPQWPRTCKSYYHAAAREQRTA